MQVLMEVGTTVVAQPCLPRALPGRAARSRAWCRADRAHPARLAAQIAKGESELTMREEREMLLQHELNDLQMVRQDLEMEISATAARQAAELQPQIDSVEAQLEVAKSDLERQRAGLEKLRRERAEAANRMQELRQAKTDNETHRARLAAQLVKIKSEPDKVRKQAEVVNGALISLEAERGRMGEQLQTLESELEQQVRRRGQLEDDRMMLEMSIERHQAMIEQRERTRDEMLKQFDLLKEEALHVSTERTRLAMDAKALDSEAKWEQNALNRKVKEYNAALKRCKKAEMHLNNSLAQHPFLQRQLDEASRQVAVLKDDQRANDAAAAELRREVDVFISQFLNQESAEQEKQEWLRQLLDDIKGLEVELSEAVADDSAARKAVAALAAEREAAARESAKVLGQAHEVHEELKVKELVVLDLTKRLADTGVRLKDFSKLYDMVKSERNKYVNKIQSSQQALAETKEKIKILQNEVEILRAESALKDRALYKERLEHSGSFNVRDQLRAETNRVQGAAKEQEGLVGQSVAEIENLNAVINGIEREMLKLKRSYEVSVEERNYTGIQLIDRNDELCILYEKSNMQQATLRKGEAEIRKREEETRALDLRVAELCRATEVTRRKLPRIPELEEEVVRLQSKLAEEQELANKLTGELETPERTNRWRRLEGKDPEPEDLAAKLQVLEERLNDKKEQLLEKELVLEEVTNLANRLRAQAVEGREDAVELSKRVNEFQGKIKGTTRRMMATVSELSMYQATAMKLTQENAEREAELGEQEANLGRGLPPSEQVESEWARYQYDMQRRREALLNSNVLQDSAPAILTQTTAEPRPNAYIPDDIVGIPKPYGGLAPFKPTELGSSMRHIRKPVLREIEL